ncbi:eCIS core domain-containing protein [Aquimarina megaterium]|uniref:eCIS core domain-containing protein n=1 Tax=Aquimarina megaterium TaxID=1443666 RepID=UPI0009434A52|nr:DUF4157 domain-containing protein [Aquimarina megaterium]
MFRSASVNTTNAKSGNSSLFQKDKSEEGFVQPKLTVGKPNDKYEVEADRVADQVVAKTSESTTPFFSPAPFVQRQTDEKEGDVQQKPIAESITPVVLRQPEEETAQKSTEVQNKAEVSDGVSMKPSDHSSTNFDTQKQEEEVQEKEEEEVSEVQQKSKTLQRKEIGVPTVTNTIESRIQRASDNGKPMSKSVKGSMESGFGTDFSGVKVHTDSESSSLNKQMSSKAFTYKNNVFFGENQYQPETKEGKHLIAHELTHVVQQGHAQKGENAVATETVQPKVQRLGISDALDYFADAAHNIPGFRMFTIILGINPINMSSVDRSAANIMRAIVEFLPGGNLITRVLDKYNVFTDAAELMNQKIEALNLSGASIKKDIDDFLDGLGWSDIFNLGGVWRDAMGIISRPINAVIEIGKSALSFIWDIVRKAILTPLAVLAQNTDGYDLLKALIGEDPITKEAYPPTAENLIGGFMKFIGQEEIWTNIQQGNAVGRAWVWFQQTMSGIKAIMSAIPGTIITTIKSLTWEDIIILPNAFIKVGKAFASIAGSFLSFGLSTVIELLKILFSVVAPGVLVYIEKAQGAFNQILENPIGFVGNLINAAKLGFNKFARNIGKHLKNSLLDWLLGSLAGAGIYIPQALSFQEIIKFVLSVLGLTWENLRAKLVEQLGEPAVVALETGFELVKILVTEGPAAAWEKIMEHLSNLQEMIISEISQFVIVKVVQKAVTKLVTMLNPAGAVIQAIIAIYDTVTFLIEKLQKIARVAAAIIDSLAAIANGVITQAAAKVESTLAGMLTLAINFLAKFTGLDKVSEKIIEIVEKIREPIDTAMTNVVTWVVTTARSFIRRILGGGNEEGDDETDGDGELGKTVNFSDGEEGHRLWVKDSGQTGELMVASSPKTVEAKIAEWEAKLGTDEWKDGRKQTKKTKILGQIAQAKTLMDSAESDIETAIRVEGQEGDAFENADDNIEQKQTTLADVLKQIFMEFGENADFKVIYAEELGDTHQEAKATVDASVDSISETVTDNKTIQSWSGLVNKLKETSSANKLFANPLQNGENYETFAKGQAESAGKEELGDKFTDEKNTKTIQKISSSPGSEAFRGLRDQVLDKSKESDTFNKLKKAYKSDSDHNRFKPVNVTEEAIGGGDKKITYNYAEGQQSFELIVNKDRYPTRIQGSNLNLHDLGRGTTQDSTGKVTGANQDSAHLIANMFGGSGFNDRINGVKTSLNLMATSDRFNRVTMLGQENSIKQFVLNNSNNLKHFDLTVEVTWASENDTIEISKILEEVRKLANDDERRALLDGGESEIRQIINTNLARTTQPRVLDVVYTVVLTKEDGTKFSMIPRPRTGPDLLYATS